MAIPALIVLAVAAGFLGALVEWGVNAVFHTAFAARVLGLAVFGIVLLAGSAGAIHIPL